MSAKVLNARLAKVLNLLTTSLTTWLCNAREHVAKSGEIRQRTTDRDNSGGSSPSQKSAKTSQGLENAVSEQKASKSSCKIFGFFPILRSLLF